MNLAMLIFWNGTLFEESEAPIAPSERGLLLGEGVFETLRVYNRVPFAFHRHIVRLRQSAARLGFPPLPSEEYFHTAVSNVVGGNDVKDGRVRITVTGGSGPMGVQRANETVNMLITTGKLGSVSPSAHLGISPWRLHSRSALTAVKTTSYAERIVSLNWANDQGYQEALVLNENDKVIGTTAANAFFVLYGDLVTPPLLSGAMPGITRELITESMEVLQHDIGIEQLRYVEEGFLTSSLREVQPIASINGRLLNMNGAYTDKARSLMSSFHRTNPDP